MTRVLCCIPARLKSTRLPNKPLLKINGKTIINLVYDQVKKVSLIDDIVILTDTKIIKDEVNNFGGKCEIIEEECLNGTERIILYLKKNNIKNYDVILNVQGDEPFINPDDINIVLINYLKNIKIDNNLVCQTLYYDTQDPEEIHLRSRGKLVLDKKNNIMYCSRNIIPATKKFQYDSNIIYKIHIGVFVFNYDYLINHYFNENTHYQLIEDIEWMKIMEQGFHINATKVNEAERGVDTLDDYNYLVSKYI